MLLMSLSSYAWYLESSRLLNVLLYLLLLLQSGVFNYNSMFHALMSIWRSEGVRGDYKTQTIKIKHFDVHKTGLLINLLP